MNGALARGKLRRLAAAVALILASVWCFCAEAANTAQPAATSVATTTETRRAFLLGVKNYPDHEIQTLQLPEADAKGIASDLEQIGFDKKNITTALNLRAKADFDRQFGVFLATVKPGDVVFFYYSGHGVGLEATNTDYLLLSGVRSLFTFAKDKLPPIDRANDDIVRLKMPSLEPDYENEEIAKNGVSVQDVIAQIAAKKPRIMILMLDACRSIATQTAAEEELTRGPTSGSQMLPTVQLPPGAHRDLLGVVRRDHRSSRYRATTGKTRYSPSPYALSCSALAKPSLNLPSVSASSCANSRATPASNRNPIIMRTSARTKISS